MSRCSFEGRIAKYHHPSIHIQLQNQVFQQITYRYFSSSEFVIGGLNYNMGSVIVATMSNRWEMRNHDDVGIMP
jgi:hypothetical protein